VFVGTEINVVNGFVAIALGFCLLGLVAWVDRRYLQRYEEVQSEREEQEGRKVEQLGVAATEEDATTEPTPVTTSDELPWKDEAPTPAPEAERQPEPEPEPEPKTETDVEVEPEPEPEPVAAEAPPPPPPPPPAPPVVVTPEPVIAAKVATIDLRDEDDLEPEPEPEPEPDAALPKGAEAALESILAAIPDPRNTVALVRDPTAEVRLTPAERQAAEAAARRPQPAFEPTPPTTPPESPWARDDDRQVTVPGPVTGR
jgi:hypothetical protein